MEYKRSTFQLGLQARNVNKAEKNHNGSYCIVHLKPVKCQQQRGNDKRTKEKRRVEKKR